MHRSTFPAQRNLAAAALCALGAAALLAGCTEGRAPEYTGLTRETHDAFEIAKGAHSDADCNACHGDFDTFKEFTCKGCHTEPDCAQEHGGMPGYEYDDRACYACHASGDIQAGDHARFFPIGSGTPHQDAGCASCHADPANRQNLDCINCHSHDAATTAPQHTAVDDFAQATPGCLRCHADGQVDAVSTHEIPIGSGAPHATSGCLECHPAMRADKPWGADFAAFDCLACHKQTETDAAHAAKGVADYAWNNASCLICHPTADRSGTVNHQLYFPIGAGTSHQGLACATCHVDPGQRQVVDCTNCHTHAAATAAPQHSLVGGYAWSSPLCLRCHADSQVDRVAAHLPFDIRFGAAHYRESCVRCHPGMRTDKPYGANFAVYDCLTCHNRTEMDQQHVGRAGYVYQNSECLRCHSNGGNP